MGGENEDSKVERHPGEGSEVESITHDEVADNRGEGNGDEYAQDIRDEYGKNHDAAGMPGSNSLECGGTDIQMDEFARTLFHFSPCLEKTF